MFKLAIKIVIFLCLIAFIRSTLTQYCPIYSADFRNAEQMDRFLVEHKRANADYTVNRRGQSKEISIDDRGAIKEEQQQSSIEHDVFQDKSPLEMTRYVCGSISCELYQFYYKSYYFIRDRFIPGVFHAPSTLSTKFANLNVYWLDKKERARYWYTYAAKSGNIEAQTKLGVMLLLGIGGGENTEEAKQWFLKAAEKGDSSAQNNLAWVYENKDGDRSHREEAVKWYEKAKDAENPYAMYNYARLCAEGKLLRKDSDLALELLEKAAWMEHYQSQYLLGRLYERGELVGQDMKLAEFWQTKSMRHGFKKEGGEDFEPLLDRKGIKQDEQK